MTRPRYLRYLRRPPVVVAVVTSLVMSVLAASPTSSAAGGRPKSVRVPSVDVVHAAQLDAPGSTTALASPWVVMPSPDPSSVTDYLNGVSCVQQFCMAVGNQGAHGGIGPLAETWDGATWEVVPMLDPNEPSPANGLPALTLVNGVSCAAPSFCVAVGESNFTGRWTTLAERWDGASWSMVPSGDTPSFEDYLLGVACPSTRSCTTVGSYINGHAGLNGTLGEDMGDGGSFSIVATPDQALPLGGLSTPANHLFSVSCPGTGPFCASVGYSEKSTTDGAALPREALAESSGGGAWSLLQAAGPGVSNQLNSVSCASATSCTAVGWSDTAGDVQPLIESWDGQTWSAVRAPAGGTSLDGVSCLDTGTCAAVGRHGLVDSWDGKTWSVVPTPQQAGTSRNLHAVSCMSGTCTAVGSTTSSSGTTTTLIEQACSATSAGAPEATRAVREQAQIGGQQPSPRSPALSLFGAPASTCPLVVEVVPLEGNKQAYPLLAGLHYNRGTQEPSFFIPNKTDPLPPIVGSRPFSGAPFEQKCGTGCTNIFVYVREPGVEEHPVSGAHVTLQAYAVAPSDATYPYPPVLSIPVAKPEGFNQFKGELCVVSGVQESGCGDSAKTTTDSQGIAYFRYWAPGIVKDSEVLLTATAVDKSPACDCRTGTDKANVYLSPNVVFDAYTPLTQQAIDYFSHWWEVRLPYDDVTWATNIITKALPELKWADQLGKVASTQQQRDITAVYVLFSLFGLQPDGLITLDYRDSLIGFGKGFLTSLESVMKDFGGVIHGRVELDRSHPTGVMQLVLSEQSYCGAHAALFAAEATPTSCESSPGKDSYILFSLGGAGDRSDLSLSGAFHETPETSVSYMPGVWMKAQDGKGLIIPT